VREAKHGFVLILCGAEAGGELRGREEFAIGGTGWIRDLLDKALQASRITQGKDKIELKRLAGGHAADSFGLTAAHGLSHMMRHDGLRVGDGHKRGAQERQLSNGSNHTVLLC
jgi:hypothetical protein